MRVLINTAIAASVLTAGLASAQQLLIPESSNDQVMLFDANDGSLINANFIDLTLVGGVTPIECILGPDGLYVSDQSADTVFKYSADGTTFIGQIPTGLDNVRGIEIVGNTLYVANAGTGNGAPGEAMVMFDLAFNNLGFTAVGSPFDVLDRGTELLVCDITNEDLVRFDYAGVNLGIFHDSDGVTGIDFPEQANNLPGGGVLVGGFSTPSGIYEYDAVGAEVNYWTPATGIRGAYLLGNGLILYTNSGGVHTYDTATGITITVHGGVSARFIALYGGSAEPGTQYCAGDGLGTPCPCGNNNSGTMGGCDWGDAAFPEGGILTATGSASMGANDTNLVASGVSNDFGVFFGADNQVNGGLGNPLNDGLRCAGGALVRLIPPTVGVGNGAITPSPVQLLDTGAAAGVTRRYQYWFRTPGGPCAQDANLTNGYEIVWAP